METTTVESEKPRQQSVVNSHRPIVDWVREYDNIGFVPNASRYFEEWPKEAEAFRRSITSDTSTSTSPATTTTGNDDDGRRELTVSSSMIESIKVDLDIPYGLTATAGAGESIASPPFRPRQLYDVLTPIFSSSKDQNQQQLKQQQRKGIFIFVHGGYWYKCDKSWFTHLAKVPLLKGYQVVIPGYTLCPDSRVADISKEIAQFLSHLHNRISTEQHNGLIDNDETANAPIWDTNIVLCGHSAGGHLVTRQLCEDLATTNLPNRSLLDKVTNLISLSGVHDLRPITKVTNHNEFIRLDDHEARMESPALLSPVIVHPVPKQQQQQQHDDNHSNDQTDGHLIVTCMVGSDERPEFIRQTDLLSNVWRGMGITINSIHVPQKHHFNILDVISDPDSILWTQILM